MTLAGASVLVVDDEPLLTMTFGVLLQREGAIVHTAAHGLTALAFLEQERVHVMLCDQQMPVMDGMTLLRTMRARDIRVPVVLFINGIDRQDEAEYASLGVAATLTKPVKPELLNRVLAEVLAHVVP